MPHHSRESRGASLSPCASCVDAAARLRLVALPLASGTDSGLISINSHTNQVGNDVVRSLASDGDKVQRREARHSVEWWAPNLHSEWNHPSPASLRRRG